MLKSLQRLITNPSLKKTSEHFTKTSVIGSHRQLGQFGIASSQLRKFHVNTTSGQAQLNDSGELTLDGTVYEPITLHAQSQLRTEEESLFSKFNASFIPMMTQNAMF